MPTVERGIHREVPLTPLLMQVLPYCRRRPGRSVDSFGCDAKDATVIADQARMRRDLTVLQPDDEQAIELRVLTGRRADLNADRTRRINRLRGHSEAFR